MKNYLLKKNCCYLPLLKKLKENDSDDFRNYLRMDVNTYGLLLELVRGALIKQNTKMREASSPEKRLMATLRHTSTGTLSKLENHDFSFQSTLKHLKWAKGICLLYVTHCRSFVDLNYNVMTSKCIPPFLAIAL